MSEPFYFDKDGKPIDDVLEWSRLFGDWDYKVIGYSALPNLGPHAKVMTIWVGHDTGGYSTTRVPNIFESMVFKRIGDGKSLDEGHYATLEAAKAGHEELVKKWGAK